MSPVSDPGLARRWQPLVLRRRVTLGAGPVEPPSTGSALDQAARRGGGSSTMSLTSALDDETVAAATSGDAEAIAVVYSVLAPKVVGYLRAHGADDSEGLTNEVFLHVLRRWRVSWVEPPVCGPSCSRWPTPAWSTTYAVAPAVPRSSPYEPELDDRHEPSAEHAAVHAVRSGHLAAGARPAQRRPAVGDLAAGARRPLHRADRRGARQERPAPSSSCSAVGSSRCARCWTRGEVAL